MADLQVDPDGLDALAERLRGIVRVLDGQRESLRGALDEVGDEEVADGLARFEERWRDGRRELSEEAEALAGMLAGSAQGFRDADRALARALVVTAP